MIRHRSLVTSGIMLAVFVSSIQASSLRADAKPKAGTYRDNGVVIKKNADGSIETYDSSDGPVTTIPSGTSGASSSGSHSGPSTRNIDGVKVKKNSDGSIETSDTVDSYESNAAPASSRSSKSYTKSMGGVTVKKNADGSIETFDSGSAQRAIRSTGSSKVSTRKASTSKTGAGRKSGSPAKRRPSGGGGGVHVRKNADGSIETWD